VSFATTTLCVASQQLIPKVTAYFIIDSVRELLDTSLYALRADIDVRMRAGLYSTNKVSVLENDGEARREPFICGNAARKYGVFLRTRKNYTRKLVIRRSVYLLIPSLLSNGYRGHFPRGNAAGA